LKNTLRSGERVVRVSEEGKPASSIFRPLQVFADASLVEVRLLTGRTHQIRVHAASIGQPIAGDEKYGDEDFNRQMKSYGLRRLFLHAKSLAFALSGLDEHAPVQQFDAPLDEELAAVLNNLPKK
jgi:23S rRNA pseudouridine955/2504/2580 synthase